MKTILLILISCVCALGFFYLISRLQMKAWLSEVEDFLKDQLKNRKDE